MQEFFKQFPAYRAQDVIAARNAYFATVKEAQYLKSSAKFIFEGMGVMKKSALAGWCERVKTAGSNISSEMRGKMAGQ
jgi:hypothetical protein